MKVVEMRDAKKIRRFLFGVNSFLQPDSNLINEGNCNVEHILPKAAQHWSSWKGFSEQSPRDWIHRIGNLALLEKGENKPGEKENSSFSQKRNYFERSSIALTQELSKYENWSPKTIAARQIKLAKQAAKVWSF